MDKNKSVSLPSGVSFGYGEADSAVERLLYLCDNHVDSAQFNWKLVLAEMRSNEELIGLLLLLSHGWLEQYSYFSYHGYVKFSSKFKDRLMSAMLCPDKKNDTTEHEKLEGV